MNEKNSPSQIFCKNVKHLRKIHKLSKKEMAKALGIGVASLTKLENGILPPHLPCEILFHIESHFRITPSEIISDRLWDNQ